MQHTPAAYAIWPLIASIAIKSVMSLTKRRYGRKIRSSALMADAWNDTVDVLSGSTSRWLRWGHLDRSGEFIAADHLGGMAVGLIVIFLGIRVVRDTTLQLMDTMPDPRHGPHPPGGAHCPRRAGHRKMLRPQDRPAVARGSASGSGPGHERLRFPRAGHARCATGFASGWIG